MAVAWWLHNGDPSRSATPAGQRAGQLAVAGGPSGQVREVDEPARGGDPVLRRFVGQSPIACRGQAHEDLGDGRGTGDLVFVCGVEGHRVP